MTPFASSATRRQMLVGIIACLLALSALAGRSGISPARATTARSLSRSSATSASAPIVSTRKGRLRGIVRGGVREFLGVPYAAPPIGNLRFRAPRPSARWRGARAATRFGHACIQFEPIPDVGAQSENCLYLNIWEPKTARPSSKLPVLLWYHGGGLAFGAGSQYRGQRLAQMTNTIVITINYRLGALGYLALPQLDAENSRLGSGNYGLLDQIRALKWVRSNISAFGGDRRQVTIAGESAGGLSVCAVLASPLARGLFERAIIESFPCASAELSTSRADAERTGASFAAAAGCTQPQTAVSCLRRASPATLAHAALIAPVASVTYGTGVLPLAPGRAIESRRWNRVPVLLGTNRHEGKLFSIPPFAPPGLTTSLTDASFKALVTAAFGQRADQIETAYSPSAYKSPWYAFADIIGDGEFSCPTVTTSNLLARQVPTYRYEFNDPHSPGSKGFTPPGIDMSNSHTGELGYIFDYTAISRPLTAVQKKLSRRMIRYWGAFVHGAKPVVPGQRIWPGYRASSDKVLSLRPTGNRVITNFNREHHCALWAQ